MKIVNTDNFASDYPNESFVNIPPVSKDSAETIVILINNECSSNHASRSWKVVADDYKLKPGFEP